jgi:sialic acid synthase SpsE
MNTIKINDHEITKESRPYFIADIAANHDGSLTRALKLIELAKSAGADAAKFQNFQAEKIVSRKGFDSLTGQLSHQNNWKKSVYEIYEEASINTAWTQKLKEKCDEVGIEYFTSPYDYESVEAVDPFVSLYKIGSGDITWLEMIEYIARKKKPVLIATGASSMDDVKRAIVVLKKNTEQIVLMQCNTNYTGSNENFNHINLNVLKTFRTQYPELVLGLSDHTPGHSTVLGAVALGATVFEKHFTDDNQRDGPDHKFAMNPKNWREMVNASSELFNALGDGVKVIEKNEKQTALVQRRALRYKSDLPAGYQLSEKDVFPLRPYSMEGYHPYEQAQIIGKRLVSSVSTDDLIRKGDLLDD